MLTLSPMVDEEENFKDQFKYIVLTIVLLVVGAKTVSNIVMSAFSSSTSLIQLP